MEIKQFNYGQFSYDYHLVFQDRKTIALTVQPNLKIILRCPFAHCEDKIEKFLKRKWIWLEKQLHYFRNFQKEHYQKEFVSGESFLYLGRQYKLLVKRSFKEDVKFSKGIIQLFTSEKTDNSAYNKKLLNRWYDDRTKEIFQERYKTVLKKFDYNFEPQLITRKMNKRWGSFLSDQKIILNSELIKASKDCIDYVIAHELCHIKYKNHDKKFYNLLESKASNWKEVKDKLELRFVTQ